MNIAKSCWTGFIGWLLGFKRRGSREVFLALKRERERDERAKREKTKERTPMVRTLMI